MVLVTNIFYMGVPEAHVNPYSLYDIGESRKLFPKNGRLHRGYPGNFFQTFSRLKFWVMRQGMTHEAGDVPETIPR